MNHYKRGCALIFNHYQFDNELLENREGTEKDVAALEEILKLLQFDVSVFNDYTYAQIYDKLNEGEQQLYKAFHLLMCFHGELGNRKIRSQLNDNSKSTKVKHWIDYPVS